MTLMPYVHQEYPKWLYHPTLAPRVVANCEAHGAVGPGWFEHPNDAAASVAPPSAVDVVVPDVPDVPTVPVVDPDAAERAAVYAANVATVLAMLKGATRVTLERVAAIEARNPKGARKSVLTAIDAALAADLVGKS